MPKLTDIEFATMVLMSMDPAERAGVCLATLKAVDDPAQFEALRDVGHKIARHADTLERHERQACEHGEHCRPGAISHAPGTFPGAEVITEGSLTGPLRGFLRRQSRGAVHG